MSVVAFPKKRFASSTQLRNSVLARPCRRVEAHVVIDGRLAEILIVEAGNAQKPVDAYIAGLLHALFDGGTEY